MAPPAAAAVAADIAVVVVVAAAVAEANRAAADAANALEFYLRVVVFFPRALSHLPDSGPYFVVPSEANRRSILPATVPGPI